MHLTTLTSSFCQAFRLNMRASWTRLIAVLLIIQLYAAICESTCRQCVLLPASDVATLETLANSSKPLGSCNCDAWRLGALQVESSCNSSDYLLFEFWRMNTLANTSVDTRYLTNVYFLVARSVQPELNYTAIPVYYPPRSLPGLYNGTNTDEDGYKFVRSYHRIFLPVNASGPGSGAGLTGSRDWFITVGNMEPTGTSNPFEYTLRVSCVAEAEAPCPRPSPFDKQDCSGNGNCGPAPVRNLPRSGLQRVCYCNDSWGDYGCQVPAAKLGQDELLSKEIRPGDWAYWQISVPRPHRSSLGPPPALLVELSRTFVGADGAGFGTAAARDWRFGGDPILVVMPKGVNDSNRLPTYGDLRGHGDLQSFMLQQNYHYLLLRDLPATLPGSVDEAARQLSDDSQVTAEFYVAVLNDRRNLGNGSVLASLANVTLRVRWRSGADDPSTSPLCPNSCFSRGRCSDPKDQSTDGTRPLPDMQPPPSAPTPDFQCNCLPGFGGSMCEGDLHSMTVTTTPNQSQGLLSPGKWAFVVLKLDKRFNGQSDDVAIMWTATDTWGAQPMDLVNAYMMVTMQSFPRNAAFDSSGAFTRAWQVYYPVLMKKSTTLILKGSDLNKDYSYVLGLYNSDYLRVTPSDYRYDVTVFVPVPSRTWLHPYMSVVLGVTASIILCLLMTLCRRVVQRYGWAPFRNREPQGGQGANGHIVQAAQMVPRHRGVPDSIIETFHSYEYKATKAEKEQLSRSCRDHEQQQQQQQQAGAEGEAGAQPQLQQSRRPTSAVAKPGATASAAPPQLEGALAVPVGDANIAASGGNQLAVLGFSPPTPAAATAAALPQPSSYAGDDGDDPQCTVCLCEYEECERITQLPCKHEFHSTCINKWLRTHHTCPICRVSLLPEEQEQQHDSLSGQLGATAAAGVAPDGTTAGGTTVATASGVALGTGMGAAAADTGHQGLQPTAANTTGPGGGWVPATAATTAVPPRPQCVGFMARLLGRGRRTPAAGGEAAPGAGEGDGSGGGGPDSGRTQPAVTAAAPSSSSYETPSRLAASRDVAESRSVAELAPVEAVFTRQSHGGGGGGSARREAVEIGGALILSAAPLRASQPVAHGPSTVLSPPAGDGGEPVVGRSAGGSPGDRMPVSPSRLSAGRQVAVPVLLGADVSTSLMPVGGSSGGSGRVSGLRNPPTLVPAMVESLEPPGVSSSPSETLLVRLSAGEPNRQRTAGNA